VGARLKEFKDILDSKPKVVIEKRHAGHILELTDLGTTKFNCGACGGPGKSWAYHCSGCEWNCHVNCCNNPQQIQTWEAAEKEKKAELVRNAFKSVTALGEGLGLSSAEVAAACGFVTNFEQEVVKATEALDALGGVVNNQCTQQ